MGCQSPPVPFIIVGAWGFAFEPSPFFWTIKISSEKAETNQWESTGLISVLLDRSNLSQESLVVVYHLCTPKHGAVDRRLACDAEGAKQVLRRVGVCIQSFVIQVFFVKVLGCVDYLWRGERFVVRVEWRRHRDPAFIQPLIDPVYWLSF